MLPTSLPGGSPGGITAARPTTERAAMRARFGMAAASRGVRPPNSALGSSAQPSGTRTTYFTRSSYVGRLNSSPHGFYPRGVLGAPRRTRWVVAFAGALAFCRTPHHARSGATTAGAGGDTPPIRLKRVAKTTDATAMAVRSGDPARYVTLQQGIVMAYRSRRTGDDRPRHHQAREGRRRAGPARVDLLPRRRSAVRALLGRGGGRDRGGGVRVRGRTRRPGDPARGVDRAAAAGESQRRRVGVRARRLPVPRPR